MTMKYAALSIIVATSLAACGKPAPAPAPEPTALVRTAPAASQALDEQITLYGQAELDPAAVRTLTANYEARVEAIHVAVGESVDSGQPIATLAPSPATRLDLQRLAREASAGQRELQRQLRLRADGLASDADVAQARAAAETAQQSSASLAGANHNGRTVLTSPTSGVVDALVANLGDQVAAGGAIARVGGLASQRARLGGEVEDLARIRPGQSVVLESTRTDGRTFDGQVESLDQRVDPGTRLAGVLVRYPGTAGFLPGESLKGRIVIGRRPSATVVPRAAVLYDGDTPHIFVVQGGKAMKRTVRLGLEDGERVQLLEGVRPGEVLVIEGGAALSDGMKVRTAAQTGAAKANAR